MGFAATQLPSQLHQMHILIPESQSLPLLPYVPSSTTVHFHPNASSAGSSSSSSSFATSLVEQGWIPIASASLSAGNPDGQIISFTSPTQSQAPTTSSSNTNTNDTSNSATTNPGGTVKLLRKKRPTTKAQKSSIWAAYSPMLEEPEKLLTAEDKKRPECVFPDPVDGAKKRRKRA